MFIHASGGAAIGITGPVDQPAAGRRVGIGVTQAGGVSHRFVAGVAVHPAGAAAAVVRNWVRRVHPVPRVPRVLPGHHHPDEVQIRVRLGLRVRWVHPCLAGHAAGVRSPVRRVPFQVPFRGVRGLVLGLVRVPFLGNSRGFRGFRVPFRGPFRGGPSDFGRLGGVGPTV